VGRFQSLTGICLLLCFTGTTGPFRSSCRSSTLLLPCCIYPLYTCILGWAKYLLLGDAVCVEVSTYRVLAPSFSQGPGGALPWQPPGKHRVWGGGATCCQSRLQNPSLARPFSMSGGMSHGRCNVANDGRPAPVSPCVVLPCGELGELARCLFLFPPTVFFFLDIPFFSQAQVHVSPFAPSAPAQRLNSSLDLCSRRFSAMECP